MLTKSFVRAGLAAVITTVLISCGNDPPDAGDSNKVLFLSAIPDEKITDQQVKFDKLAAYLTGKLGVKTEFLFSKDYADAVTKFRNGEVHLVWFGGLSGVQARMAVEGARAIAQGKADPNYKSYVIVNVKTGLEAPALRLPAPPSASPRRRVAASPSTGLSAFCLFAFSPFRPSLGDNLRNGCQSSVYIVRLDSAAIPAMTALAVPMVAVNSTARNAGTTPTIRWATVHSS